ncbi:MAG: hypothetical protein JWO92_2120 [Chitinophagaceae bacterium]|nr:hypothetical protein [Chitinophagaceae bacterium]
MSEVANGEKSLYFSKTKFLTKTIFMTQTFSELNWIAILVGTIGYFALGAIWYSFLFQKKWIAYNKIDMSDPNGKKGVGAIMFASFILMFVTSLAIAILVNRIGVWSWMSGVKLGAFTGVCFACTSMGINMLYEKKPLGLFFINGAYQVLGNIIAAVIIVCWQ